MTHIDPPTNMPSPPDKGPLHRAVMTAAIFKASAYFDPNDEQAPVSTPIWWTAHIRAS